MAARSTKLWDSPASWPASPPGKSCERALRGPVAGSHRLSRRPGHLSDAGLCCAVSAVTGAATEALVFDRARAPAPC
jgi:hypothetical protein